MKSFLLAAASSQEHAVWLAFCFYVLNLLVPIIPAVIIYRLFPENGVGRTPPKTDDSAKDPPETTAGSAIEGSVAGWKVKAVGAWGAYVTAFVLGYWAINSTVAPLLIALGGASVWKIDSEFQLEDENGNAIDASIDKLRVDPPMVAPWGKSATITAFSETLDPPDKIQMALEGYNFTTVSLAKLPHENGKIKLPAKVVFTRLRPLDPTVPAPTPLPPGTGPKALAVNQ